MTRAHGYGAEHRRLDPGDIDSPYARAREDPPRPREKYQAPLEVAAVVKMIDRAAIKELLDHIKVAHGRVFPRSWLLTAEEIEDVHASLHEPRRRPPVDE